MIGYPKIFNLGSAKTDLFYEHKSYLSQKKKCCTIYNQLLKISQLTIQGDNDKGYFVLLDKTNHVMATHKN